jgi:hypothetical protein
VRAIVHGFTRITEASTPAAREYDGADAAVVLSSDGSGFVAVLHRYRCLLDSGVLDSGLFLSQSMDDDGFAGRCDGGCGT